MKITTIFAMTPEGDMGVDDEQNYNLPWERNAEDMAFLKETIRSIANSEVGTNVVLLTLGTAKLLPRSMFDLLEELNYKVVLLSTDIRNFTPKGHYKFRLPEVSNHAKIFKHEILNGIGLFLDTNTVSNILYLGSPRFLSNMMNISDVSYVTILKGRDKAKATHTINPYTQLILDTCPQALVKEIKDGYILKVASKHDSI